MTDQGAAQGDRGDHVDRDEQLAVALAAILVAGFTQRIAHTDERPARLDLATGRDVHGAGHEPAEFTTS